MPIPLSSTTDWQKLRPAEPEFDVVVIGGYFARVEPSDVQRRPPGPPGGIFPSAWRFPPPPEASQ